MSLQDLFPYNSTIVGLRDVYVDNGSSVYVNNPCVKAPDHIITTSKTYVLVDADLNGTVRASSVELRCVFYHDEHIYLLLMDTESRMVKLVHQFADAIDYHCSWKLLDWDYLKNKTDESL